MDRIRSMFSKQKRDPNNEPPATAAAASPSPPTNNGLSVEYFQTQLLLHYLLKLPYHSTDHEKLVVMCFEQLKDDTDELRVLNEFEASYASDRALSWYLQECFLYKILNYSLESQDMRHLFLFRRVLHDIEQQMEQHRCSTPLHVYRSQWMPTELLDRWISSVGQCIAVNSFMSATTSHEVALTFLNASQPARENHERVLLEIDADPRVAGSKPFVQLGSLSYGTDKHEILFMFGSVFLINGITCGNEGVYTVELTLYSDAEHEFKPFFDGMARKYADKEIDLLAFAQILFDLDRFNEVEDYVQDYLDQLPTGHVDTARCFRLLGATALAQAAYDTSLNWYNQSLELNVRSGHPSIAEDHENIAHVHFKRGNHR